jgi:hypothetical protein
VEVESPPFNLLNIDGDFLKVGLLCEVAKKFVDTRGLELGDKFHKQILMSVWGQCNLISEN